MEEEVTTVVGVSGKIGHGKDEVAKVLVERGFVVVRFSDELKREVLQRLRRTLKEVVLAEDPRVPVDAGEGWWDARLAHELWSRKPPIIRKLLQEFGTEVRRADDPDYWCKKWYQVVAGSCASVVAPDVRFENEARYVKMFNGRLVRVFRPGCDSTDTHPSETALDGWSNWDAVIVNDGTLDDFREKVLALLKNWS